MSEYFAKYKATDGIAETTKEKCKKWAAGSEFGAKIIHRIDELVKCHSGSRNEIYLHLFNLGAS